MWGLVEFLGLWALVGRAVGCFAMLIIVSLAIMSHQSLCPSRDHSTLGPHGHSTAGLKSVLSLGALTDRQSWLLGQLWGCEVVGGEAPDPCSAHPGKEYEGYIPLWFERKVDAVTGELICVYKGGYWEAKDKQDWSVCPDIF